LSKTIAITGGSGFIGTNLAATLVSAGHRVKVVDLRPPAHAATEWEAIDILDFQSLVTAFAGCDVIFHLAAAADVNRVFAYPAEAVAVNTLGTANVLEAARQADAGRVVLASTIWVYAASHDSVVDETTRFDPRTDRHLYVTTKVAAEMLCRDFATLYGRPYTILRYGIPYGPHMRDNVVSAAFLLRAMRGEPLHIDGDGRQERSFVYIADLVRGHLLALDPIAENKTYNLDGAEAISIRRIAETVKRLVGNVELTFGPPRPGDLAARTVKTDLAREELGWIPEVPFEEGMRLSYQWLLAREAERVRHG
jgi:UDP-glucose 4-epimerase